MRKRATPPPAAEPCGWNHATCHGCYAEEYPGQVPVRIRLAPQDTCCRCGAPTSSGIYVRREPASFAYCRAAAA